MIIFKNPEEFTTYLCCFLKEHKSYKRFLKYHSLNNDKEFQTKCLTYFEGYTLERSIYILLDMFLNLKKRYSKDFDFFCELRLLFLNNVENFYFPKNFLTNEQCWDD